jgi:hypothetical protein
MVKKGVKATPSASMRPRADLNTGLIPSFNLVEGLDALGVHIDVMQAEFQHLFASYDDFTAQKRMIVTDLQSEASDNDPCTFMRTSDSAKWQCFDLPPSYANNREISTWPASDWQLAFCKAACAAVKAQQPICEDMSTTLDVLEHVKGTVAKWGATLSWDNMHEAMFLYFHGWPMEEVRSFSRSHCELQYWLNLTRLRSCSWSTCLPQTSEMYFLHPIRC